MHTVPKGRVLRSAVLTALVALVATSCGSSKAGRDDNGRQPFAWEREDVLQFAEESGNLHGPPKDVSVTSLRHVYRKTYSAPPDRCVVDVWEATTSLRREWIVVQNPAVVTTKTQMTETMGIDPVKQDPSYLPLVQLVVQTNRQAAAAGVPEGDRCSE